MNRRLRTALVVTAALGAGLLMTACEGDDTSSAPAGARSGATATPDSSEASDEASSDGKGGNNGDGSSDPDASSSSTDGSGGKELTNLIVSVSVSGDDPNPVSLEVDPFIVDEPIVTSWHTSAADAVPFSD